MNDKQLEQIQTVDVNITAESIDAHVICLRENGYNISRPFSLYTRYVLSFLIGATVMGAILLELNPN